MANLYIEEVESKALTIFTGTVSSHWLDGAADGCLGTMLSRTLSVFVYLSCFLLSLPDSVQSGGTILHPENFLSTSDGVG